MKNDPPSQLTGLVLPRGLCPTIGVENGRDVTDGVALFFQSIKVFQPATPYPKGGSYRFVRFVDGEIVAGLQVMSRTGSGGEVANVYCREEWRRMGFASELLEAARARLGDLSFSDDRSADGAAWVRHIENDALAQPAPGRRP